VREEGPHLALHLVANMRLHHIRKRLEGHPLDVALPPLLLLLLQERGIGAGVDAGGANDSIKRHRGRRGMAHRSDLGGCGGRDAGSLDERVD
jgi:hypothetical protein